MSATSLTLCQLFALELEGTQKGMDNVPIVLLTLVGSAGGDKKICHSRPKTRQDPFYHSVHIKWISPHQVDRKVVQCGLRKSGGFGQTGSVTYV